MAGSLPTLLVNVGHIHYYLRDIRPASDIGVVASALYPPHGGAIGDPAMRARVRLLDPVTFQLQLPTSLQSNPVRRLPYAEADVDPKALANDATRRNALIKAVADQSRAWDADRVIAPYFHAVDPDDPAFEASLALASSTLDTLGPDAVVPAVFIEQNALMPQHRDDLLNRLTRTDFDVLYLLVGVDAPSTAPISNDNLLSGIRLVVEVLAKNGIHVIWGATDTTGLLAAAWAPGSSFALGPETYLRRRHQPTPSARPRRGFTPATKRVFSRELLSELKVDDYTAWRAAGRLGCSCAACTRSGPVDGRLGHYVNNHVQLAERLNRATDPPRELATMVDAALTQIGGGPADPDARRHLTRWRAQLP